MSDSILSKQLYRLLFAFLPYNKVLVAYYEP